MSDPKRYNLATSNTGSKDEHYKRTQERIAKIQSHLSTAPRNNRLKGKVCVITGVGSLKGIGRASALLYAHEGAQHLYLIDFSGENLPNLKETIAKSYPDVKVDVIQADAADEKAIQNVCEKALKDEGRLDVFFANAGIASQYSIKDTDVSTFMEVMRVNALSGFLAIKYGSAAMKKTKKARGKPVSSGSIILTASVAGLRSGAGTLDYSASKAAVNSMAKNASYQLRDTDIRVNSICPGLIETNMPAAAFEYARSRGTVGKLGQLNPMGRYGVSEEIAQAALFLASDESSYVNGQNIAVDGGLSASHPVVPGRWA